MTVRVRHAARFDRSSPVLRYWLGRCEGFEVAGGAAGVVQDIIFDGDPYVPDALVVRTKSRRTCTIRTSAVAVVVPAERRLVLDGRPRPERPPRRQLEPRRHAAALAETTVRLARIAAPVALALMRRLGLELLRLARLLALAASAGIRLVRSVPWRRYGRSVRSGTTRRSQALSRSSSPRRTTSSRRSSGRSTSRGARTTSST